MSPARKAAVADGPDLDNELRNYDDRFTKNIGYSVAAHVAVVLLFTIKVFLFPDTSQMLQSAVRVDLVALPDKIQEPQAPPKPEAAPPPAAPKKQAVPQKPQEEKAVVLNPKKDMTKKQLEAMNRLKQMEALEKLEEKTKTKPPAVTYKGNVVSKGSELRGLSLLQHESYVSDVEKHIRRHWVIPQWLANRKDLKTKVRVKFDESGAVTARDIVQSSGNPSFDEAVLATLEKASPVPKPPDKLQRVLAYEGILVGFPE